MGKIVLLMGKSTTGKDTVYKNLLERNTCNLKKVVLYTTRPMRDKEENGVQYFFCDEEGYQKFLNDRKIIEGRTYDTCYGPWRYFTVDDGQIDLESGSSLMIGTIEAYESMVRYFGKDKVVPVYIEISDRIRLERAMHRENKQEHPKYDEMCRRYLADEEDFSEEKIKAAGITRRFNNEGTIDHILDEITEYLKEMDV
ncbi:Guanylate kinase [Butyrivibrio fibrisolvens DSM 3071]|jgi:guanylate kinase|uniref:Guanylate kinase n=1 Tax=Butyrivibrio fibrisolvens DSM 3071 TaxID=1121131 RepID=A0A1M6ADJ3_BUTFI|nr:guanylate kinase [Butyrivibrio fibrisolvens]SHI34596.1 Guanylate kinase [Butyrivibrio fibrisolvens DSM 3071]